MQRQHGSHDGNDESAHDDGHSHGGEDMLSVDEALERVMAPARLEMQRYRSELPWPRAGHVKG